MCRVWRQEALMRLLLAGVLALLVSVPAAISPTAASTGDCFVSANWRAWSAPRNDNALYLRVQGNGIYRVELARGERVRRYAGEFLVNQARGSAWICSALDLDLALTDYNGFSRTLIATELRRLTPEEIAAIPREDMP